MGNRYDIALGRTKRDAEKARIKRQIDPGPPFVQMQEQELRVMADILGVPVKSEQLEANDRQLLRSMLISAIEAPNKRSLLAGTQKERAEEIDKQRFLRSVDASISHLHKPEEQTYDQKVEAMIRHLRKR